MSTDPRARLGPAQAAAPAGAPAGAPMGAHAPGPLSVAPQTGWIVPQMAPQNTSLGEILMRQAGLSIDALSRAMAVVRDEGGELADVLLRMEPGRRGAADPRAQRAVRDALRGGAAVGRGHRGGADREPADRLRQAAQGAADRPRSGQRARAGGGGRPAGARRARRHRRACRRRRWTACWPRPPRSSSSSTRCTAGCARALTWPRRRRATRRARSSPTPTSLSTSSTPTTRRPSSAGSTRCCSSRSRSAPRTSTSSRARRTSRSATASTACCAR